MLLTVLFLFIQERGTHKTLDMGWNCTLDTLWCQPHTATIAASGNKAHSWPFFALYTFNDCDSTAGMALNSLGWCKTGIGLTIGHTRGNFLINSHLAGEAAHANYYHAFHPLLVHWIRDIINPFSRALYSGNNERPLRYYHFTTLSKAMINCNCDTPRDI